jgi:hypothetical protein
MGHMGCTARQDVDRASSMGIPGRGSCPTPCCTPHSGSPGPAVCGAGRLQPGPGCAGRRKYNGPLPTTERCLHPRMHHNAPTIMHPGLPLCMVAPLGCWLRSVSKQQTGNINCKTVAKADAQSAELTGARDVQADRGKHGAPRGKLVIFMHCMSSCIMLSLRRRLSPDGAGVTLVSNSCKPCEARPRDGFENPATSPSASILALRRAVTGPSAKLLNPGRCPPTNNAQPPIPGFAVASSLL